MKLNALEDFRLEIDKIDNEILSLLAKRMCIVKKIGKYKKENHIPVPDSLRETQKIECLMKLSEDKCLDKKHIAKIYRNIIDMSKEYQNQISC